MQSESFYCGRLHSGELRDVCWCGDKIKKARYWGGGFWQVWKEEMCMLGFVVKHEGRRQFVRNRYRCGDKIGIDL